MIQEGRHEWFLQHVLPHRGTLSRYLRKFISGTEDLDDLVQESLVRVYAVRDYAGIDSPQALLMRIAHNLAVERARRRTSQATDSMAELDALNVYSPEMTPEEQADTRQRYEVFCQAVDGLPPMCRRAFLLRKVYQFSHAEIAAVLGISASTIEKHVAKGLVRCRERLRELGLLDATLTPAAQEAARCAGGGGREKA